MLGDAIASKKRNPVCDLKEGKFYLLKLFLAFTVPKSHLTTPNCNRCHFSQTTIAIFKQRIHCIFHFQTRLFMVFWSNISFQTFEFFRISIFPCSSCYFCLFHFHWCFLEVTVCVSKNYSKCGPFVLLFSFCFCLFCIFFSFVFSLFFVVSTFIDASCEQKVLQMWTHRLHFQQLSRNPSPAKSHFFNPLILAQYFTRL